MTVINPGSTTIPIAFGTAAARPAPSAANSGTGYYATDTGEVTFSNGSAWSAISSVGGNFSVNGGTIGAGGPALKSSNGIDLTPAGSPLKIAEGSNAKQGTYGPLVAGTLAVANTSVTASSRIIVCRSPGGTNAGAHYVSAATAGTGFTVTSTNASDTGSGVFIILEPG